MAGALGFESSEIDGSIFFSGILQFYNTKFSFLIILLDKIYFEWIL